MMLVVLLLSFQVFADDVAEIPKFQSAYEAINTSNPFSEKFGTHIDLQNLPIGVVQIKKILDNPIIASYMKVLSKREVASAPAVIASHPKRNTLIYAEIGWIILMIWIRFWRYGRTKNAFEKFWVFTTNTLAYLTIGVIVIPWVVLGRAFGQMMIAVIQSAS